MMELKNISSYLCIVKKKIYCGWNKNCRK